MNTSDLSEVKELTPEWYTLPDFLRNVNNLDLGTTQVRSSIPPFLPSLFSLPSMSISNLITSPSLPSLPPSLTPWAPTAEDFIRLHRAALESE